MTDLKRWQCRLCSELMTEAETEELTHCVFAGNREEPPEYAGGCANPRCHGTHEDQEEVYLCKEDGCDKVATEDDLCTGHALEADGFFVCNSCGKEPVPDEHELCGECYQGKLEMDADAYNEGERT